MFSAGAHRGFQHQRAATAESYLEEGVRAGNVLGTDLGDDDGSLEGDYGRIANSRAPRGDDALDVWLTEDGNALVRYRRGAE